MDRFWMLTVAAAVLLLVPPASLADHGTNLAPDPMPQDCDGNVDVHGDGIGVAHHYVGPGVVGAGADYFPITVSTDPPGFYFGDGDEDRFGSVVVFDGATDWCPEEPDPASGSSGTGHYDGEWEFGVGGAFLNELHHDVLHSGFVCVEDDALGFEVEFTIASDVDDDGAFDMVQPTSVGCDVVTLPAGAGPPSKDPLANCEFGVEFCGLQRGWWVMVHTPATSGVVHTVLEATCGPDTFMKPTGKAWAGGTPNEFQGTVTLGIKVGVGRVLVAEGVTQVGGPAGNPNVITEVSHTGTGGGSEHKWNVGGSADIHTRTFSYSFTTQCVASGTFTTHSGTFKVYN